MVLGVILKLQNFCSISHGFHRFSQMMVNIFYRHEFSNETVALYLQTLKLTISRMALCNLKKVYYQKT